MQRKRQMLQKHWPKTCARTLNPNNFPSNTKFPGWSIPFENSSFALQSCTRWRSSSCCSPEFGVLKRTRVFEFPGFCAENSRLSKFRSFRTFGTSDQSFGVCLFGVFADQSFKSFEVFETFCRQKFPSSRVLQIFAKTRVSEFSQTEILFYFSSRLGDLTRGQTFGRGGGVWASSIGVHKKTLQSRILYLANILAFFIR
jgi:hypothetical protein